MWGIVSSKRVLTSSAAKSAAARFKHTLPDLPYDYNAVSEEVYEWVISRLVLGY